MNWARDVWPSERARLMSGHMMPTERQAVEATVEILEMNSWLEDEMSCQAAHENDVPACTVAVTSMLRNCIPGGERPVCAAIGSYAREAIERGSRCINCGEFINAHWHVRDL